MKFEAKSIVLIEDNEDISKGFSFLINSTPNYYVSKVYENCEDALLEIRTLNPDIILMDIDLPGINGIEGTLLIKKIIPNVEIVIITIFENSSRVFEALQAGATGYLTKNNNLTQLIAALDEISAGGSPMSANIARMVATSFKKSNSDLLTDKEKDVLTFLVAGKSYKSIAQDMEISIDTVKFHIKNIYLKLQVGNKEDAISKALAERLV